MNIITTINKLKDFAISTFTYEVINQTTRQPTGYVSDIVQSIFNGDKFPGSFGNTKSYDWVDYWTLRKRSVQLFKENPYCKGIIRRLLRNEIGTGLNLEASPVGERIGMDDEQVQEWSTDREIDWSIWSENPELCDWKKQKNLDEIANDARMTALISGDCLVVLRINVKTGLPTVELIDGSHIQTPTDARPRAGNKIIHGVEVNAQGRHVAFHIITENLKSKRIPATGEKSKRRIAWLIYGSERRLDEIRGEPIMSNVLYMLKEVDRYRDSEQRAATVNSLLPFYIERGEGIGTKPVDSGAIKKGDVDVTQPDGTSKRWDWASMMPGAVMQNLGKGEKPVSFNTQRPNINFGTFEETILNTFAWTLEVPPETMRILYGNSFSASRQAKIDFGVYLKFRYWKHGKDFYQPIYNENLIQQTLLGDITSPGFLDAWRNPREWRVFGSWINAEWVGESAPSVDFKKDVDGLVNAVNAGFCTHDFASRRVSGIPYKVIVKKVAKENEMARDAGVSFTSEEDQNKVPLVVDGESLDVNGEPINVLNQNINNKFKGLLNCLNDLSDNIDDKFDDLNGGK